MKVKYNNGGKLVGNQKELDKNKDGEINGEDFKVARKEKKAKRQAKRSLRKAVRGARKSKRKRDLDRDQDQILFNETHKRLGTKRFLDEKVTNAKQ